MNNTPQGILLNYRQTLQAAAVVCGLSFLPLLLTVLGLDFGSQTNPLDKNKLASEISVADQLGAMAGLIHHAALEWIAVLVAFAVGLVSLVHFHQVGNIKVPIVGIAFLCAATVDGFHILASSGSLQANSPNKDLAPFTWALSRFMNAFILVLGVALNLWIYRRFGAGASAKNFAAQGRVALVGIGLAFFGLAWVAMNITLSSDTLPQTTFPRALITRPFDILPLALFVLSMALAWSWNRQHNTAFTLSVLLCMVPQIAAQMHMSFGSTGLFDNHFNIAHGLKIVAYACVFAGILINLIHEKSVSPQAKAKSIQLSGQEAPLEPIEIDHAKLPQAVLLPTVVFVLSVTLTIVVGASFYWDSSALLKEQEIEKLQARAETVEPAITSLYQQSSSDVRFLSRTPPIQGMITAFDNNDTADFDLWHDRLEQIFSERLANQNSYLQIRFIGLKDHGREIVNVSRIDGLIHRIPQSRLQQKGDREYVRETVKLLPNQVYFSRVEYNREFGRITLPVQPVLRVATPIYHPQSGEAFGLIIVNINFSDFVGQLNQFTESGMELFLANKEGDFLLHKNPDKQFGFESGRSHLMQAEFPDLVTSIANNTASQVINNISFQYDKASSTSNSHNYVGFYRLIRLEQFGASRPLRLLVLIDNSVLQQNLIDYRNRSFLLGVTLAVLALALAVVASRRVVAPLVRTTLALEELEKTGQLGPLPIEAKDEVGVLARRFNNLIAQRQAQDKELNDQRFALNNHVIVAATDVRGNINYANKKFCEISGYSAEELIGKNHRILNSGYHQDDFFREMYLSITQGNVWNGQICNKNKNGQIYWVDTTIVPFMDEQGHPNRYIALRTEITEQKLVETQLLEAKVEAEQGAKAKSEFLASMSHEIRTPMNGVLGMLNLLSKTKLDDEQERRVDLAKNSAQSLLSLINDILDFSKIEAGKLDIEIIDFDIAKLLGDFSESMAVRAEEKRIELVLDVTQLKYTHVKGDPGRIRQILTNLVGNALKFTEAGEVIIRASLQENENKDLLFACEISDTGIGIPEDKVNTLFDSFTQVDASTTRKYGGTGLGLSIVKQLCELMHGEVSVNSQLGKGTTFSFTVIFQNSSQVRRFVPSVNFKNFSILIVDDNDTNREVLRGQLELWGAMVVESDSGPDALAILEERHRRNLLPFSAVILDMQMPGMDGAELGEKINKDKRFSALKLIVMTSMTQRGDAQWFADIGFSAYFPKPAIPSDIYNAMAVVMNDGDALQQASPLVTHHYLHSLESKQSDYTVEWPNSVRLLLVDDNYINLEVALGLLEDIGLQADTAANGKEALAALLSAQEDAPYSLILMDCQMPIMDGFEASRKIRAGAGGQSNSNIPIVALTANAMKGDREKCLSSGMSDYISKPIDENKLLSCLRRWLLPDVKNGSGKNINNANVPAQVENLTLTISGNSQATNENRQWDLATALKRVGGKEKRLQRLIDMYFANMPERIARLEAAIAENDLSAVATTAHEIKGVVGNFSAEVLARTAAELEQAGIEENKSHVDKVMLELLLGHHALSVELQNYRAGLH